MLNFTWWVNRKDVDGRNLFQGGFLGLDNIGVFDRSKPLPFGGWLDQADGTAWMAMYCLNLLRIALELAAEHDHVYEDIASKFFEHFLEIAEALENVGGDGSGVGLWNEEDQFYYDAIRLPSGDPRPVKVRSTVGLIPLFAVETIEPETLAKLPDFAGRMEWFLKNRPAGRGACLALGSAGTRPAAAPVAVARPSDEATPQASARRDGVPLRFRRPLAVALLSRSSVRHAMRRFGVVGRL